MPARNSRIIFLPYHYYHVYNRGAHKSRIFHNRSDFAVFMNLLKRYFSHEIADLNYKNDLILNKNDRSLLSKIELNAFCLLKNHFHLLIYLKESDGLTSLMRAISSTYTLYYNEKYEHSGTIFQGKYKATIIKKSSSLRRVLNYIHDNETRENYEWSSLIDYSGKRKLKWLSRIGDIKPPTQS